MRTRLFVALALVLIAQPATAIELHLYNEGLRLDVTESLFVAYHGDLGGLVVTQSASGPTPENQFVDILNKLNAVLAWRRFRLATRFDTAGFLDTPDGSCGPPAMTPIALRSRFCQRYFYPEKLSLEYTGRTVEATLGDFYVSFGRGLILSLRKLDELGIDTTLTGGKFVFHEGDTSAVLVAGASNIQNVDEATGRVTDDPYDAIAGGRVEERFGRSIIGLQMSGGANRRNANTQNQFRPDSMLMYGGTFDSPRLTQWLSVYAEADGQMSQTADKRMNAYALYGAATGYFGPVAVLLEVKHYANFQRWKSSVDPTLPEFAPIAYNQPPTAERIVTELTSPVYDVSGPRLRVDWRINPSALVYASYAYFFDRGFSGNNDLQYHDPYAGAELRWNNGASHFFPSGGYRAELCSPGATDCFTGAPSGEFQHIGHLEWDFAQMLPRRLSIESQGQILFRRGDGATNADGSPASWTEGDAYLALKWTPYLVFAGGFEWSTRPPPTNNALNQYYENGSIQWNITTASSIRVWAGGMRGGLRCISGICRQFPPFTGARLEVVVRL